MFNRMSYSNVIMDYQTLFEFPHVLQTFTFVVLVYVAFQCVLRAKEWALFTKLPTIQQDGSSKGWRMMYLDSARKLYQQGYERVGYLMRSTGVIKD